MIEIALAAVLAQPLPRINACPLGYYASGSYCVPSRNTTRQVIEKEGAFCPLGWYSASGYCVRSR
jgi:hypothetical protein